MELIGTPGEAADARAESEALLLVRLRRTLRGEALAVEKVWDRDLTDAMAELWMETCLRRGFAEVSLGEMRARVRPAYRDDAEAGRYCAGFELEITDPSGATMCRFFARECLWPVAERGSRRLMKDGTLQPGDLYFYDLAPGDGGESRGLSGAGDGIEEATLCGPRGRGAPGHMRVPLGRLLEHAETANPYTIDGPYPVFFTRSARRRAERLSRRGAEANPPVETGGLLIGPLCVCPDTGEMFAVIIDVLEAADSEATTHKLIYSGATWARIQAIVRARQADPTTRHHRILGQCHGHNFLPFDGSAVCEDCPLRMECSRSTANLSAADRTWARAVFNGEPWCVSQIFGLDARSNPVEAFYGQRGGSLVRGGYYVIEDFEEALHDQKGARAACLP
jgi:hypothetical protein